MVDLLVVLLERRVLVLLRRKQLPTASASISVPMKQRNASSGVHTIGSPRTLKLVFTSTGQPVSSLNALNQRVVARVGLAWTVWMRAE